MMEVGTDPRLPARLSIQLNRSDYLRTHSPVINSLPTETLLHIFQLTCHSWWRTPLKRNKGVEDLAWHEKFWSLMSLPYPEVLSHVCCRWRQIVLSSPALWSQIDMFNLEQSSEICLSRASALVSRAQNHHLMLKLTLRHGSDHPHSNSTSESFCSLVGPRLKSLRIDNEASDTTIFSSVVRATISHAAPGILTDLTITDRYSRSILNLGDNSDGLAGWTLPSAEHFSMSQSLLDDVLRSIRILRLTGQFLPWASPAYQGLVDLRLLCTRPSHGHRPSIRVAQLREILLACPKLRAFHFGIKINGQMPQGVSSPVPLNDLEELDVKEMNISSYGDLFPLLAPGHQPFKLVCRVNPIGEPTVYCPALLAFFQRSQVTRLYVTNRFSIDCQQGFPLEDLLAHSPTTLLTLGLERFKIVELAASRAEHTIEAQPPLQLNCLCLRKCAITMNLLRELAKKLPAQLLKLHIPQFEDATIGTEAYARGEITSIFPIVKWVYSVSRMEQWDTWVTEYINY
ncbi:hypothetical protein ACGC1H_002096 [Rhizoctonia solani]